MISSSRSSRWFTYLISENMAGADVPAFSLSCRAYSNAKEPCVIFAKATAIALFYVCRYGTSATDNLPGKTMSARVMEQFFRIEPHKIGQKQGPTVRLELPQWVIGYPRRKPGEPFFIIPESHSQIPQAAFYLPGTRHPPPATRYSSLVTANTNVPSRR